MASEFELQRPRITEIHVRMDCNGCVQKIKKALHGLNGIHELYIDFPQQKLTIIGRADPQRIMKAIKKVRKVATLCSHTEVPDPNSQPTEHTQDGGAPPPEGEAPPAEGSVPGDAQPAEPPRSEEAPPHPPPLPQEPPNDHPPPPQPPENPPGQGPQPESNHPPGQADMQPSQPSGSAGPGPSDADEEEEVHVTYHNPHDNGRRYGYGHGYGPGYRDNYGNPWSSQPGPSFGYRDRPRPVYHEPDFHEQRRPVYNDPPSQPSYYDPPTRPFYHEPPGPPPRDVYYERLPPQTRYHEPPPPRARYHDSPTPAAHYHEPAPPPPPRAVYHEQPPQQVYATQSYNMYRPAPSVTQYHYAQSPPRYTPRHRTDYYYEYNTDSYQYDSTSSGNVPSIFSDENPNACTIV